MVYSNHQLITQYLEDPSEANFDKIVKEFSPMVYSVCYRVLNRGDLAEEASQATFLSLIEKKDKLVGGPSMIGWLHRVAYLSSLWLRKQENIRKKKEKGFKSQPSNQIPEQKMEESELHAFVDEAIQSLPSKYKDPLLMKFYENKTYREIGVSFKTTEESVRKRVNRGLEKMKVFLKKRDIHATSKILGIFLTAKLIGSNVSASSLPDNCITPIITEKSVSAVYSLKIFKGVEQMILLTKLKATALVLSTSLIVGASGMAVLTGEDNSASSNNGNGAVVSRGNEKVPTAEDKNNQNKIGKPDNLTQVEYIRQKEGQHQKSYKNHYKKMNEKFNNDKLKFYSFWSGKAITHANAPKEKSEVLTNAIKELFEKMAKDGKEIHAKLIIKQKAFYAENGKVNYKDKVALNAYKAKSKVLYDEYRKSFTSSKAKQVQKFKTHLNTLFSTGPSNKTDKAIYTWLEVNNILNNQWSRELIKKDGKTFYVLSYRYKTTHHSHQNSKHISIKKVVH
ncbi:MAG: hypothetical protein COA79_25080 [Planctomycetota bacterium]|nr:MAG: hypothetical protein COA79_25080 [Planctomycetota bacterium]